MDPYGERCDHQCGRRVVWYYGLGRLTLGLCAVCSAANEDALADKGWRVLVA